MPANAYTEDQLVEQPAIRLFAELGWQTVLAMEEVFGLTGTLGRETSGEVVLAARLRAALEKLNPKLPVEAIASAVDELTRDRSAMSLVGANREVCGLLKDGVKVSVPDHERGGMKDERLLDIAENFTLFSEHKSGLVKAMAQNHQYLGVNNAIAATLEARKNGHGRGGVFWQTQGSGKSFSMVFFAQKRQRSRSNAQCDYNTL